MDKHRTITTGSPRSVNKKEGVRVSTHGVELGAGNTLDRSNATKIKNSNTITPIEVQYLIFGETAQM
jgi:hypothetical protein